MIAAGGRPRLLDLPNVKELCISSDDLFWMKTPPKKTLVVGSGYIGLECGGFIRAMGYEVDLLYRSAVLRGFDVDMAERI